VGVCEGAPPGRGGVGRGVGVDLLPGLDFRNTPNPPDRPMELIVGWPPGLLYARLSHWARWGGGEGLKASLSAARAKYLLTNPSTLGSIYIGGRNVNYNRFQIRA